MSLDSFLVLIILFAILLNKAIPPTSETASKPCIRCGKFTSLRCSRCHEAYYCSPEHMSDDWANHKVACRRKQRPVLEALLFPVDRTTPAILNIPYSTKVDADGIEPTPYHDLDTQMLKRYLRGLEMKHVTRLGSYGRRLDCALVVLYSSDFNGLARNQCVASLTEGSMHVPWSGNVLVLRQEGALYSETYASATMEDVAVMSRFFAEYRDFVPYEF
ncbi:hypothetical protein C8R43DRAFT_983005 [Mycena crocata]|nr:hypothetical protein C8R43DRAFT_983005 [Mycena crocata]